MEPTQKVLKETVAYLFNEGNIITMLHLLAIPKYLCVIFSLEIMYNIN